jgi:excinuclease ABC subunit C
MNFDISLELTKLPEKPGVYMMRDKTGAVIYVGKAIILKNRVRQYFQNTARHSGKVASMVSHIAEFEYIVTGSEFEALVLESNLIKKYRPKYNVLMKDDKSYPYIKITLTEEFPRIILFRGLKKDGSRYFGPYISATRVREMIDTLKRIFPFRQCETPRLSGGAQLRPCLNRHIGLCLAPCNGNVSRGEYMSVINDVIDFLDGKTENVTRDLERKMIQAAEAMDYEKAAVLRDRIRNINVLNEKQKSVSTAQETQDVVSIARGAADSCAQVFFVRNGKIVGRENFILASGDASDDEIFESFVTQFYEIAAFIPPVILTDAPVENPDVLQKWLSQLKGSPVRIKHPVRGGKAELIEMVHENARIGLDKYSVETVSRSEIAEKCLMNITALLALEVIPDRIEAYDVSNTGTSERTASMVVFTKGLPDRTQYRRFKLRQLDAPDDYGGIREVLTRRLTDTEDKYPSLPDLILIDGGRGHVSTALAAIADSGCDIRTAGMQKDAKHHSAALVDETGRIIDLSDDLLMLRFITGIQNETHRFALEYNKKLRAKRHSKSGLDDIPGIGPKKKMILYRHFGSLPKVKEATIDELTAVKGISAKDVENIIAHFR